MYRNRECYLIARHYPRRDNSFNKQHLFFAPEERHFECYLIEIPHVYRKPEFQRNLAPEGRQVHCTHFSLYDCLSEECYLRESPLRIATVGNRNSLLQVACGDHNLTDCGTRLRKNGTFSSFARSIHLGAAINVNGKSRKVIGLRRSEERRQPGNIRRPRHATQRDIPRPLLNIRLAVFACVPSVG